MNRFAMLRKTSQEVGVFVVIKIVTTQSRSEVPTIQLLLQSEQGEVRAFVDVTNGSAAPMPGLYERIFALLLILHFGQPRYGFIEEFILLPDTF